MCSENGREREPQDTEENISEMRNHGIYRHCVRRGVRKRANAREQTTGSADKLLARIKLVTVGADAKTNLNERRMCSEG